MYKSSVVSPTGIEAHVVLASKYQGREIWTLETKAPKFIDAECLTGDTLLHFERQAKPGQQCLATMSLAEFHDKWVNGIEKVSKLGHSFFSPYKTILSQMRLRCYDFASGKYMTTNVVDVWCSGEKEVYRVTCDGVDIQASANHYFLTQRGWVPVKELSTQTDSLVRISHNGKAAVPKNYLSFNRAIKEELLENQEYRCLDCQEEIDRSCDIHHIVPVSRKPELAFDKSNVVALCPSCHVQRHAVIQRSSLCPTLYPIDNISYSGKEKTYDLTVAHEDSNFVANGFVVHNCEKHRVLSSNSSSSRAIPFKKQAESCTFYPQDIRAAEKGMQGSRSVDPDTQSEFLYDVSAFRAFAIQMLTPFKDRIHKQHLNRYLEPWAWQKKVVTATEWDNFFRLRLAPGAQPEIQELARCMKQAMDMVRERDSFQYLEPGQWHLPYVLEDMDEGSGLKCSTARCARVSYMTHDNESPVVESDVKLYSNLLADMHMTPFEHQATPMVPTPNLGGGDFLGDPGVTHMDAKGEMWSGNFKGWIQHRQLVSEWNM